MHDGDHYKTACPHDGCGSSDGYAVYTDGHGYCFVCETYDKKAIAEDKPDDSNDKPGSDRSDNSSGSGGSIVRPDIKEIKPRKLLKKTCLKYGYGYAKGCHVASYRSGGKLTSQHYRTRDKDFFWVGPTKTLELYGQHLWQPGGRLLVITEGEIDCLSIAQTLGLKVPVVSVPSGAASALKYIKQNLRFVESFKKVVIAFDTDEPGVKAAKQCAQLLKVGKASIASWNGFKDANELLLANRGVELPKCIFESKPWRPDGIVLGSDVPLATILFKPEPGVQTPYEKFNAKTLGIHGKRFYLITAGSGIGKSTLGKEICYDLLMNHNKKVGVLAWEEDLKQSAEGFMSLYLNTPIHITRPDDDVLTSAYNTVINHDRIAFDQHWGSSDIDVVLTKMRYMVRALDMDVLLVDHVSIVVSGNDEVDSSERKQLDQLMTALRTLVEETGVTVIAVSHLKRPGVGKSWNEGRQVALTDLRGSAALEQIPDFVVSLEGNQQGDQPNIRIMRVLKNRLTGVVGIADTLEYNPTTGRLLPYEEGAWDGTDQASSLNDF